jgi:membrane-bound serine protease (ClpP class)
MLTITSAWGGGDSVRKKVYVFPIRENIMPAAARLTDKCLSEAAAMDADIVVIDMNTYGGMVDAADSIRTRILNYDKPVYVFINNQAASAGALIALAADSIYMRDGASIGAATVVDETGQAVPDKYQSFMRAMMRSTAESHGKIAEVNGQDTVWKWRRNPQIAEAMVDPSIVVEGVITEGKVLSFSPSEAMKWGFCEGMASSVEEVLTDAGIEDYEIHRYEPTFIDGLLGFLTNPAFQGIMIMLIIGGIYFELQTPGVGFPLAVAILGALLYFAPLYMEGVLANWELVVFILGIVLIILEIFVTPGFGVLGIAGIVAVILGLAFAMIDTDLLRYIPTGEISIGYFLKPIALVIIAVTAAFILSIWLGRRILVTESKVRGKVVLTKEMNAEEGFVSHSVSRNLVGKTGVAATAMRPAGKALIDGKLYEAAGNNGRFIEKGIAITVVRDEGGVLYCNV